MKKPKLVVTKPLTSANPQPQNSSVSILEEPLRLHPTQMTRALRAVPDIAKIAAYGGLPAGESPPAFDELAGSVIVSRSCNNTLTQTTFVHFGLTKLVEDARTIRLRVSSKEATDVDVVERVELLRSWVPKAFVREVADPHEPPEDVAAKLYRVIEEHVPELEGYRPPRADDRNWDIRCGERAERYYGELKLINRHYRSLRNSRTAQLDKDWPEGHRTFLRAAMESQFANAEYTTRMRAKLTVGNLSHDERCDWIGLVMANVDGRTVERWRTAYRNWKKAQPARRPVPRIAAAKLCT
jgi:hypothetical protein